MLPRWIVVVALLGGCQEGERPRAAWHGKPSAPVEVAIDARPVGGGAYQVTLTATPSADLGALELVLDGERIAVGATRRGEARRVTRTLQQGGAGRQVIGVAVTGEGRQRRSRAAVAELGTVTRKPAPPTRLVVLPDGTQVQEVR